ncbi:hypothetical protein B0H16DRAFT_1450820 [Mycena metata]|uniref:Uncharacterized protein n=1 Tax=Mycena metata TaxID=1033252 RepID=A0AAD7NT44_9AGAR|nr:hypothetical protein B0H16DRAFT_1450820 [Mycena metata]
MTAVPAAPNFEDVEAFDLRHRSSLEYIKKLQETCVTTLGIPESIIKATRRSGQLDITEHFYKNTLQRDNALLASSPGINVTTLALWSGDVEEKDWGADGCGEETAPRPDPQYPARRNATDDEADRGCRREDGCHPWIDLLSDTCTFSFSQMSYNYGLGGGADYIRLFIVVHTPQLFRIDAADLPPFILALDTCPGRLHRRPEGVPTLLTRGPVPVPIRNSAFHGLPACVPERASIPRAFPVRARIASERRRGGISCGITVPSSSVPSARIRIYPTQSAAIATANLRARACASFAAPNYQGAGVCLPSPCARALEFCAWRLPKCLRVGNANAVFSAWGMRRPLVILFPHPCPAAALSLRVVSHFSCGGHVDVRRRVGVYAFIHLPACGRAHPVDAWGSTLPVDYLAIRVFFLFQLDREACTPPRVTPSRATRIGKIRDAVYIPPWRCSLRRDLLCEDRGGDTISLRVRVPSPDVLSAAPRVVWSLGICFSEMRMAYGLRLDGRRVMLARRGGASFPFLYHPSACVTVSFLPSFFSLPLFRIFAPS